MEQVMRPSLKLPVFTLLMASLLTHPGCSGSNTVWVTGKLIKAGAGYAPPAGQIVYITFVALEVKDDSGKVLPGGDPFMAEVDQATGTFTVPGKERRGIPPGKYRIAVTQKMTRETFDATKPPPKKRTKGVDRETDTLANRFGLENSPIVREVDGSREITIDLDRPTEASG
jgi:hypothetical protein